MSDENSADRHETRSKKRQLEEAVGRKERRKLKSRDEGDQSIWFGLGMFGVIGWSIAIPTVAGIAAGLWIDSVTESQRSWTLMLLVCGVAIGCLNAWSWVQRETERKADSDGDASNVE